MVREDVFIEHNGVKVSVNDMEKWWREHPDPEFSEAHNKAVIARSIARAEAIRKKRKKEFNEEIDERVAATASYLRYLDRGKSGTPEQYFGKRELAHLRGERVKAELMQAKANGQKLWRLVDTKNA